MPNKKREVPKVIEEIDEHLPWRWRLLIVYGLTALILALIVVFGIRALYRNGNQSGTLPATPKIESSTSKPAAGTNSTGSAVKSTPTGSSLPNNGPGQVIGLAAGAGLAAAGLHFVINSRRKLKVS